MVSFLGPKQPGEQKPPAMFSALLKMPGVGEAIGQFGAFASGIMERLQAQDAALIEILRRQEALAQEIKILRHGEGPKVTEEASNG